LTGSFQFAQNGAKVFFDEIQKCPEIVTKIKFLVDEGSFKYVMSGSLLGVELKGIASAPVGYLTVLRMYPMDFEEFMIANSISQTTLDMLKKLLYLACNYRYCTICGGITVI